VGGKDVLVGKKEIQLYLWEIKFKGGRVLEERGKGTGVIHFFLPYHRKRIMRK